MAAKTTVQAKPGNLGAGGRARRWEAWAPLALGALALLAYSNSFHAGFTLDSAVLLREKQIYEATLQNVALIFQHTYWWPTGESGLYRPLTILSFLFNYAVLGNESSPEGYHWINFLLHAFNIALAFALTRRLVRRFLPSVFIAGLWGVHPLLTDSVTNIAGRADLLTGFSVMGGLMAYLKAKESRGWRRPAWLGCLCAATFVGVFSKEVGVTVIGAITLYELTWWKERGRMRDLAEGTIAVLPPFALFFYQRAAVLAASPAAVFPFLDNPLVGAGFAVARLTAVKIMGLYLMLVLWPARLSSDYSYQQIALSSGTPGDWIAWVAVCGLGAVLCLVRRRKPEMFFFGLFAFGTFLPASNLLFPIGTIMAERLLYLPAYGLIACLVLAVYWIGAQTPFRLLPTFVLVVALAGCALRTWARNPDWTNDLTLAESEVLAVPRSYKAHLMLSRALYDADAQHSGLERAISEGERSVALLNGLPDSGNTWLAYRQLAGYYLLRGDVLQRATSAPGSSTPEGSKQAWERATQLLSRGISILEASPPAPGPADAVVVPIDSAEAWQTLSGAWLRLQEPGRAYEAAIRARDLNPASPESYRSMGAALRASGRDEDAIIALMEGEMLTGDVSLSPEVVKIYRSRRDTACTLTPGATEPEPNPGCPVVRTHICAAVAGAAGVQVQLHRRGEAEVMLNRAAERYGCSFDSSGKAAQTAR